MSKIVTLEDDVVTIGRYIPELVPAPVTDASAVELQASPPGMPAMPMMPVVGGAPWSAPQQQPNNRPEQACRCGRCQRCHNASQWGGGSTPSATTASTQPNVISVTVNPIIEGARINVSPTIEHNPTLEYNPTLEHNPTMEQSPSFSPLIEASPSHTFTPTFEQTPTFSPSIDAGAYLESLPSDADTSYYRQSPTGEPAATARAAHPALKTQAPDIVAAGSEAPPPVERIIERPVFVDRILEVIKELPPVVRTIVQPVERLVRQIVREPSYMPVRYDVPADRAVTQPVRYDVPADRDVIQPVRYDVPQDRMVIVPVSQKKRAAKVAAVRPPQPFQVVRNKEDQATAINWWT